MSNNYTAFAVQISVTKDEATWFVQELNELLQSVACHSLAEKEREQWLDERGLREFLEWPGFEHKFLNRNTSILLYSDGEGSVDAVAKQCQRYLKKFHPHKCLSFEYVFTGDRVRPGEFGGGGVFITAEDIKYFTVEEWLRATQTEWEKRCRSNSPFLEN